MDSKQFNTVNLLDILYLMRRNRYILLISFLSVVITAGFFTFTSDKIYEAKATLSIRVNEIPRDELSSFSSTFLQNNYIRNQLAIIESRNLANDVIHTLQNSVYKDSLFILGNRRLETGPNFREKLFSLIIKRESVQKALSISEIIDEFLSNTHVDFSEDSDIITLKCKSPKSWEAAYILNSWINTYQEQSRLDNQSEILQTKQFLENKMLEEEQKLADAEDLLAQYQKRMQVVSLSTETEQLVNQLANFESIYKQSMTDLEAIENQIDYLKEQLEESKKNLVDDMFKLSSPVLVELQKNLAQLIAEKAAYEAQLIGAGFTISGDPKLQQMESRIKGMKDKIIEETKNLANMDMTRINPLGHSENLIAQILELEIDQKALMAKTSTLKMIVDNYSQELEVLPDKNLILARLERDVQVNSKIYLMLREQYEATRIREAGQVSNIRVLDYAYPPEKPVYPKTLFNLIIASIFGLLLGIGLTFSREYFVDTIQGENDLKNIEAQYIGSVPFRKKTKSFKLRLNRNGNLKIKRAKEIYPYLLNVNNQQPLVRESYKSIRTSLFIMRNQRKCKTIMFTSPGPGEGKSTSAINLAILFANNGIRTLLIDSDLRQPILDILLVGTSRVVGLTNYLKKKIQWKDAVIETSVKNLDFLGAGYKVQNTSELICSRSMVKLIDDVKDRYNMIIFDSPPIIPVTDAAVLASFIDGVVLVVRAGKTKKESVIQSIDLLKRSGCKNINTILTGVNRQNLHGYTDYYNR